MALSDFNGDFFMHIKKVNMQLCMLSSCFTIESYLQPYGIWVFDTALGLVMLSLVIVVICHLHHVSQSWRWAGWLPVLSAVLSLPTSSPSVFPCLDFSLFHPSWSSLSPSAQGVRLACHGLLPITLLALWPLWWLCWGLGVRHSLVAWESFISRSSQCFIPIQSVICLFPPSWRFPKKLYLFCGFLDPRNSSLLYLKFYLWFFISVIHSQANYSFKIVHGKNKQFLSLK